MPIKDPSIQINRFYYDELVSKGINPTQFVNQLLNQHFSPWKYIKYENELIERQLKDLKLTLQEKNIIKRYLTHEILRDFKARMHKRYEHSVPLESLEHLTKTLSLAIIEYNYDQEEIEKYYKHIIDKIKQKDPDFNVRTYIDNMIRLKYLPRQQRDIISVYETLVDSDKQFKQDKKRLTKTRKR